MAKKHIDTVLSLFSKDLHETVLKLATKNDGILDTRIIVYICYDKNLLISSLSYIMSKSMLDKCFNGNISKIDSMDKNDIIISDECKYFINKFASFTKMVEKMPDKNQLCSAYMGYLFLTDSKLSAYELVQKCTNNKDRDTVISGLKNALGIAYKLPADSIFTKYGRFLTDPLNNDVSPCIGRDKEISDIVDILCRKKKNNPLLIGNPGVGKTAVVEGFADYIMSANCPKILKNHHIYELSMSALFAGTKYRGDYEERMEGLIKAITNSATPIILFIDEIHTLMTTASNKSDGVSGADILKPYLTNSKLHIIGATTPKEYKLIEKDSALSRRFNSIHISEPSNDVVNVILSNVKSDYESHFDITITRGSSQARDQTRISYISCTGRHVLYH